MQTDDSHDAPVSRPLKILLPRYLASVIAVLLAFLIREALVRRFGELPPYIIFYPVVLLVAMLVDFCAGALATTVSALLAVWWMIPPRGQFTIGRTCDAIGLTIFCTMGLCVSVVAELYHRNRRRLAAYEKRDAVSAEHRKSEEALRQSAERLNLATEAANLGTWDWDITRDTLVWSPRCLALFGQAPNAPTTYQRFLEAVHSEDRKRIDEAVRTALERHEDYDVEMRTVWPDGSLHWISARGRAHYDDSGHPVRMNGATLDITERKQAEIEALAREQRLRLAADAAQLGIFEWTVPTDTVVWENKRKIRVDFRRHALSLIGRAGGHHRAEAG